MKIEKKRVVGYVRPEVDEKVREVCEVNKISISEFIEASVELQLGKVEEGEEK